jgi:hypothetical protein
MSGRPGRLIRSRCRGAGPEAAGVASSTSPLPSWLGPPVTELDRRVLAANPRMTVLLTGDAGPVGRASPNAVGSAPPRRPPPYLGSLLGRPPAIRAGP